MVLAPGWCESYWEVSQGSRVIPISSIVLLFPAASKQPLVTQHPFFQLSLFEERRTTCHYQVLSGAPLLCLAGSHLHVTASAPGNPPAMPLFVSLRWFASPYVSHYLPWNPSLPALFFFTTAMHATTRLWFSKVLGFVVLVTITVQIPVPHSIISLQSGSHWLSHRTRVVGSQGTGRATLVLNDKVWTELVRQCEKYWIRARDRGKVQKGVS